MDPMDYEGIPGAEPGAVPERPRQARARATKGLFSPDWARGRSGLPPPHLQGDLEQGPAKMSPGNPGEGSPL